jgi:hypothetical protein
MESRLGNTSPTIASPETFAAWFNERYPGSFRPLTPDDVRAMTRCHLIGRYRYLSTHIDGETALSLLEYEKLLKERSSHEAMNQEPKARSCKLCGSPLSDEARGGTGRPREYCPNCLPFRNRTRQRRARDKGVRRSAPPELVERRPFLLVVD